MLEFKEAYRETGVDVPNAAMTVGLRSSNLVLLLGAKTFSLDPAPPKVDVFTVNSKTISRLHNDLSLQFRLWGISAEKAKDYMGVVQYLISRYRVLSVTGKMIGSTTINAVNGPAKASLTVNVLGHLEFEVAFKFVEFRDEAGNILSATEKMPSDADSFMQELNWIYGLQANVILRLVEADAVKVTIPNTEGGLIEQLKKNGLLTGAAFESFVLGKKSQKADFTVFFVQNYISTTTRGLSETFWAEDACVVIDHPENGIVVPYGYEAFLVNLAHEIAHYLIDTKRGFVIPGADHHDRQNILLSKGSQTTRLDWPMINLINGNLK